MKSEAPVPAATPIGLWCLRAMLLMLGISALGPGILMMSEPSGKNLRFPEGSLAGSPFADYFIPGLLLTVFMGLLPLAAWLALRGKPDCVFCQRLNPFPSRHWAWTLALTSGLALMIWIAVQVLMVPYFFLQPLLFGWGAGIVSLCFAPGVRAFYQRPF